MTEEKPIGNINPALRRQAEQLLDREAVDLSRYSPEEVRNLVHELQAHQIELEIQNEELRRIQKELEASRARYAQLYDLAPVGHFTINRHSLILEANQTAAGQFGLARTVLIGQSLHTFVATEDQDAYYFWQKKLLAGQDGQECELVLIRQNGTRFYGHLKGVLTDPADEDSPQALVTVTDISRLKESEVALQEAEERWRILVENLPSYVALLTPDGDILFTNRLRNMLYPDELIGARLFEQMIDQQREVIQRAMNRVRSTGTPVSYDLTLETPAGKTYWTNRMGPIKQNGEVTELALISTDVTENKRAEEALRESELFLQTVYTGTDLAISVVDINEAGQFKIAGVNPTVEKLLGQSVEDLQGKELSELRRSFHPMFASLLKTKYRECVETGEPVEFETTIPFKGEESWWLTRLVPLQNEQGRIYRVISTALPVTERKETQLALQESRRFIESITNAAPYVVYIYDLNEQRNIYVNKQVMKLLAFSPEELLDTPSFIQAHIHPDDQQAALAHMKRVQQSADGEVLENEYRLKDGWGEWRWILSRDLVFKRDSAGVPQQILGTAHDITDRKRRETEIRLLQKVTQEISTAPDFDSALEMALRRIVEATGWNYGEAWIPNAAETFLASSPAWYSSSPRLEPFRERSKSLTFPPNHGLPGRIWHSGQPQWIQDVSKTSETQFTRAPLAREVGLKAGWGIPVVAGEQVLAVLVFFMFEARPEDKALIDLASTVVGQLSTVLQRKRIEDEKSILLEAVSRQREELRALTQRLAALQETERATLARELHDRVGQNLTALDFNLTFIHSLLPEDSASPARERLVESLKLVEETSETIRNVMADLRPPVLDEYGLVEALNWYAGRFSRWSGLRVIVKGQPFESRPAEPVESALFRIAQEALTNVGKHAQASEIVVTVAQDANKVRLTVADDGVGFADQPAPEAVERSGWGLLTMTERAEAINGHCRVETEPGQGTRVIVEVER